MRCWWQSISFFFFNFLSCLVALDQENLKYSINASTKIHILLTVNVSDCFLMVFCKSMLFLLATSKDSSSSVIWTCSFFFTRCTSVFNFVSASTTRAFSCSISILVCLLIYFILCEHTITPCNRFIGFQTRLLFPGDNSKNFGIHAFLSLPPRLRENRTIRRRLTRLEISDILHI